MKIKPFILPLSAIGACILLIIFAISQTKDASINSKNSSNKDVSTLNQKKQQIDDSSQSEATEKASQSETAEKTSQSETAEKASQSETAEKASQSETAEKVDYNDVGSFVTQNIVSDTETFPEGTVSRIEFSDTGIVHVISSGAILDMNDDTKMGYIHSLAGAVAGQVQEYNIEKKKNAEIGLIYFYTENGIEWAKPSLLGDYKIIH